MWPRPSARDGRRPQSIISRKWTGTFLNLHSGSSSSWSGDAACSYAISYFASYVPDEFGDVGLGQRMIVLARDYFAGRYSAHTAAAP